MWLFLQLQLQSLVVLGIQQYLYENGRIDNIFCDPYYERFTDCLEEIARRFTLLYNDSRKQILLQYKSVYVVLHAMYLNGCSFHCL